MSLRRFATIASKEIRKGDILKRNGKYIEIISAGYTQRGEGQGMHLEFMDLQTHKRGKWHLKSTETTEAVILDTYQVEVEHVSLDNGLITVSDSRHQKIDIPLAHAQWAKNGVAVGTLLRLILDGEKFVKLCLPSDFKISRS
jgi:translation elongation factor P/translation initiation factor 5A